MPQVYVLDNVITKLDEASASKYTSSSTKKLIILEIDAKSKKILDKKPFITFGRQLEFFLVSNENDPQNVSEASILGFSIEDFATDRNIGISVKYRVSCPAGNEGKVVLNLFDESTTTPGVVFEGKLKSWLKDYNREIRFSDFTTNYVQKLSDLQISTVQKAKEIGLSLNLRLSLALDESSQLKSFSVDSRDFPILLSDFEEEANFRFRANLSIAENGKVNAILNYEKLGTLENVLQEAIQKYLQVNCYLYDFCYNFENSVRKGLIANLDEVLSTHGRRIDGFFPSPDFASNLRMPEPDPIRCDVRHEIQGYGIVTIKNILEVEPRCQDSGEYLREGILQYKKARISNLEEWFRDRLERTIRRYLFDFSYVDILLKYDSESIKTQLDKEAKSIGYSIRLISTVPDLKPLKLRTEGFRFESNETFSTKQNSVKIKLGIDVRGKIENLESIKEILNDPQNDVNSLIAKEVIDSIKRVLHEVEPADFYAQEGLIYYLNDFSSKEAIKDKVATTIEASLKNKFGASSQITLQALNTELLDLINKLTGKAYHDFEILIASVRDAGEPIRFTGSFQINGVAKDKWDTFASCKPTSEDVREFLQKQLRYWFGSLSTKTLNYDTTQGLLKILGDANTLASTDIINSFGLLISIHRFEPSDTQLRIAQRNLQLANQIKVLTEANEQIEYDKTLRLVEKTISSNNINYLTQALQSTRELLQNLSTQVGNEERKNNLKQIECDLDSQLSKLTKEERDKSSERISTQIDQSIQLPAKESDFDAFVQKNRVLLSDQSANPDLKASDKALTDEDQVIDV
jgi:hypothetical protein